MALWPDAIMKSWKRAKLCSSSGIVYFSYFTSVSMTELAMLGKQFKYRRMPRSDDWGERYLALVVQSSEIIESFTSERFHRFFACIAMHGKCFVRGRHKHLQRRDCGGTNCTTPTIFPTRIFSASSTFVRVPSSPPWRIRHIKLRILRISLIHSRKNATDH